MGKRGYSRQKRGCPGVSRARAEPRAGLLFPMLPSFSWLPPGSGAAAEGRRQGGATEAVHLGRTSEDSDTSFPSRVSIFFTTTALVRLKELEPPAELKLGWKELRP